MAKNTVIFWGKVLPERAAVNMKRFDVCIASSDPAYQINAKLTLDVLVSQVLVKVEGEWPGISTEALKNTIAVLVRERIDSFGYVTGRGYDLEITGAREMDGNTAIYGVEVPDLMKDESERPLTFDEVYNALKAEQKYLRHILADLRHAIRDPDETAFLCYRAVEAIQQFFRRRAGDTCSEKDGWRLLRESLRVDKDYIIRRLKEPGDSRRHGEVRSISPNERVPQLKAARAIVNRFCLYINYGFAALSEAEFPVLKD